MDVRSWIGLSAGRRIWDALPVALGLALVAAIPVPAQSTAILQTSLQLAVCLNDWDTAIARAGDLTQAPGVPVKTQAELVILRRQLQRLRQERAVVTDVPACQPVLEGFGVPGYSGRPLQLERAVANLVGLTSDTLVPDQRIRQLEGFWQAGLGVRADVPLGPLDEARRINTRSGSGVSTGAVSRWVDVYAFLGAAGDTPNLALDIIQQRPGLLYTDDRSLLFLFDAEGRLLGEAQTGSALQPQRIDATLPATGIYYAAVTTPQHRPVLDGNGVVTGWQGIGTSAVTYTLTVRGVTPSPQLGVGGR
ncbi:hypothetical protein [Leptolyngbya sp. KIOST-1]|uniref:hypothetical protein n=1 Tax=Leptolyngbya sp. KIOST-1 TaxID=1229172 RepID=UPI000562AEDB|nr:hypothetical protein [Leptolyngbya sp. KIOST-1]